MMKLNIVSNSQSLPFMFDEILSRELNVCRYRIKPFYETKKSSRILSVKFKNDNRIELKININIGDDPFSDGESSLKLNVFFRAYLISAYVRLIEGAETLLPKSYFDGLVITEAICDIHSGKYVIHSYPDSKKAPRFFRPIDAFCAIRALTRLRITFGDTFTPDQSAMCDKALNRLISYTRIPEIFYGDSSSPRYAVLDDFQSISKLPTEISERYALLSHSQGFNYLDTPITDIFCKEEDGKFFIGAAMRLYSLSRVQPIRKDVTALVTLREYIAKYKTDLLMYSEEIKGCDDIFLKENLMAAKKIADELEQAFFFKGEEKKATIHFFQ